MTKTNTDLGALSGQLYKLLAPLTPDERARVVQATLALCGDARQAEGALLPDGERRRPLSSSGATPRDYFDQKKPKNKGEMLAVAARYREEHEGADTHSKADFKRIFVEARRNFDAANYARDISNAKRQAGLFNLSTAREASQLSHYGQQFVDALPDREAVAKLKRPKVGGRRKKRRKK